MKNPEPADQPRQVSLHFCVHRSKGSGLVCALHENATNDWSRSWRGRPVPGGRLRTAGLGRHISEVVRQKRCRPARGTSVVGPKRTLSAMATGDECPDVQRICCVELG